MRPVQVDTRAGVSINTCRNRLLAAVPQAEFEELKGSLGTVRFIANGAIHRRGHVVRHVYFPAGAVCSLLGPRIDGQSPEIAAIGNEGIVGSNAFFGETVAAADVVVSAGDGVVYGMSVGAFNEAMGRRGGFHNLVVRSSQAVTAQMMQLGACNTLHSVEARACRWLLATGDRVAPPEIALSCGSFAQRVGVPADGVPRLIATLTRLRAIEYSRGSIRLVNREMLRRHACDCYANITAMYSRLLPEI